MEEPFCGITSDYIVSVYLPRFPTHKEMVALLKRLSTSHIDGSNPTKTIITN
jgi:hypothetical protein